MSSLYDIYLLSCYNVWFYVALVRRFICCFVTTFTCVGLIYYKI